MQRLDLLLQRRNAGAEGPRLSSPLRSGRASNDQAKGYGDDRRISTKSAQRADGTTGRAHPRKESGGPGAVAGAGIPFASSETMPTPIRFLLYAISLELLACDDTAKAIKDEAKQVDTQQVKQELKETGRKVEEGAKQAVDATGKAIDKVDKKVAEEIRKD